MNKTTGIGSLPFTDKDEAINFSLHHDLPFVPELTALDEQMHLRNSDILLEMCMHLSHKKLKNQILGPATFIKLTGKSLNNYHEYFRENIKFHCDLRSKFNIIFFLQIDEPILLTNTEYKNYYLALLKELTLSKIFPILHTCQKLPNDFEFPAFNHPYLAIDTQLNPTYALNDMLLVEGFDPRKNKRISQAEYVSFTCGHGLMTKDETKEIFHLLKI